MTTDQTPKLEELINRVIHTQEKIGEALATISGILERLAARPAPSGETSTPNDGRPRAPFGKSKGMTVDQLDDQGMNYWHNVWKCEGFNGRPPRPEEVKWKEAVKVEYIRRKAAGPTAREVGATAPGELPGVPPPSNQQPIDEDVPF